MAFCRIFGEGTLGALVVTGWVFWAIVTGRELVKLYWPN